MITVYADVLVALNILFTYLILICVRLMFKFATNKWGIAIASVLGGISSLIIFAENIPLVWSVIYKIAVACVITAIAFLPDRLKLFIKLLLGFLGVTFLFGGVIYAFEITLKPQNILYINGTVYFDMDIKYLIGCTFFVYGVFLLFNYYLAKKMFSNDIYRVKIFFRKACVETTGFVDTGNNLKEGISGKPVVVGEISALASLFTYEEILFLKSGDFNNIPESLKTKLRLVPCKSVAEEFLLPCVIPDKIELVMNNRKITTDFVALALSDQQLSDGEYKVILHSDIIV